MGVVSVPMAGPSATKRPASAIEDECTGWESSTTMMPRLRPAPPTLPFAHYAMLYLDNMGQLRTSESSSILEQGGTVFTPEVRERFLEMLGGTSYHRPMFRRSSQFKGTPLGYGFGSPDEYSWPHDRRVRARHGSRDQLFGDHFDYTDQIPAPAGEDKVSLEIGDTGKVLAYYETALKHFQQINCRQIAKAFIKFIEPRKQVKHPYNGGKPPAGAPPGQKGDPEKTKPDWWPAGVQHKEPDHLKKEERLQLLIHIMRKLGRWGITADKLREVAQDSKRSLKGPEKLEEMEEMLKVRKLEERYESSDVDGHTTIFVKSRETNPKGDKEDSPERFEDDEEDTILAPEQNTAIPAMEPMPMYNTRPMHDQHLFPLPESLNFGEPAHHNRPYYSAFSYTEDFTSSAQPLDYLSQPTFSPAEEHCPTSMPIHPPVNQFDTWSTASYRPNVFDYSTSAATTQTMPALAMPYPMPMPTQELPHHQKNPHMPATYPMMAPHV